MITHLTPTKGLLITRQRDLDTQELPSIEENRLAERIWTRLNHEFGSMMNGITGGVILQFLVTGDGAQVLEWQFSFRPPGELTPAVCAGNYEIVGGIPLGKDQLAQKIVGAIRQELIQLRDRIVTQQGSGSGAWIRVFATPGA